MNRTTALLLGILLLVSAAACGRYGPPLRAEEYRDAQKAKEQAAEQEKQKSDQETNAPMPPSP